MLSFQVSSAVALLTRQPPMKKEPHKHQHQKHKKEREKHSVSHKRKRAKQKREAPMGIEPMTFCLQDRRTTTMLRRQNLKSFFFYKLVLS